MCAAIHNPIQIHLPYPQSTLIFCHNVFSLSFADTQNSLQSKTALKGSIYFLKEKKQTEKEGGKEDIIVIQPPHYTHTATKTRKEGNKSKSTSAAAHTTHNTTHCNIYTFLCRYESHQKGLNMEKNPFM
jgi:hypothetical protein